MSWASMCNTIRSRFKTEVEDTVPLLTQYDNAKFAPPDNDYWCRLVINMGSTNQRSIGAPGSNRERTIGVLQAQLFGPLDHGDGGLLALADTVRAAFKRVSVSGVTFATPEIPDRGRRSESWWQINVNCPFYSDEIG